MAFAASDAVLFIRPVPEGESLSVWAGGGVTLPSSWEDSIVVTVYEIVLPNTCCLNKFSSPDEINKQIQLWDNYPRVFKERKKGRWGTLFSIKGDHRDVVTKCSA